MNADQQRTGKATLCHQELSLGASHKPQCKFGSVIPCQHWGNLQIEMNTFRAVHKFPCFSRIVCQCTVLSTLNEAISLVKTLQVNLQKNYAIERIHRALQLYCIWSFKVFAFKFLVLLNMSFLRKRRESKTDKLLEVFNLPGILVRPMMWMTVLMILEKTLLARKWLDLQGSARGWCFQVVLTLLVWNWHTSMLTNVRVCTLCD